MRLGWFHRKSIQEQIAGLRASRREIAAAFEIERRRIERDLHDGAQQYLVAANMAVGEAQLMLSLRKGELPQDLQQLPSILAQAQNASEMGLQALRSTVNSIHMKVLSDMGLEAAVRSAAEMNPARVHVIVPHQLPEIPEEVAAVAYFFATEVLTNVAKYAPDADATLLIVADKDLHVSIVDNGSGGAALKDGHGLAGLRDRLEAFGGELRLDSPRGGPTSVAATIPLLLMQGESGIAGIEQEIG